MTLIDILRRNKGLSFAKYLQTLQLQLHSGHLSQITCQLPSLLLLFSKCRCKPSFHFCFWKLQIILKKLLEKNKNEMWITFNWDLRMNVWHLPHTAVKKATYIFSQVSEIRSTKKKLLYFPTSTRVYIHLK